MKNPKSRLRAILNQVYAAATLEEAKTIINDSLNSEDANIFRNQKRIMIIKANQCTSLLNIQTYITNSFLKYEGMGV